jgi:hypothetical protein
MRKGKDLLRDRRYLLDISALLALPQVNRELPPGTLLVSESLARAVAGDVVGDADQLAALLDAAIRLNAEADGVREPQLIQPGEVVAIREAFNRLLEAETLVTIPDEQAEDPRLRSALTLITEGGDEARATGRTIRRHLTTILAHSRRTGTAILASGRGLISRVTRAIAALELPHRADRMVERKQAFTARLISRPGWRAGKFVVGALIAAGGLANPAIGAAGLVLYFVDP